MNDISKEKEAMRQDMLEEQKDKEYVIKDTIKYAHFNVKVDRKLTIAYSIDSKNIYYGIARCHPNDNYNKKTGRELAFRRLITDTKIIELKYLTKVFRLEEVFTKYFIENRLSIYDLKLNNLEKLIYSIEIISCR